MHNHIAVDIGASSGRLIHGTLDSGRLLIRELYRFSSRFQRKDGHDYWDINHLFHEILTGLAKAKLEGIEQTTLGIDTWAVDYVLLDAAGVPIREVFAYRDARTNGAPAEFHKQMSRAEVYGKTGIQELSFNTLYQLSVHDSDELKRADTIMLVPDYLYFRLTGRKMNELTNASTTQMLNLKQGDFDIDLLNLLGLSRSQFSVLTEPGTKLGPILPYLKEAYDLPECELIAVPTHDTASAVVGVPAEGRHSWAFLSSGTWSLLGAELAKPLNTEAAMIRNYTNERGAYGTTRFLKNIMGLWMIQEARRVSKEQHSFSDLVHMAEKAPQFLSLVVCNDPKFLNPDHMIEEIQRFCLETGQPVPNDLGEIVRCIIDSLALTYRDYLQELEEITGQTFEVLHIVGGGANNALLCQLTADLTGKTVKAGPSESTAIGNLAVQMITCGFIDDLSQAREIVASSFDIQTYHPLKVKGQEELFSKWRKLQINSRNEDNQ